MQLLTTSRAEDFPSILDYVEAGQKRPNRDLRKLASSAPHLLKNDTKELVTDMQALELMESRFIAYRSIKITESGFAALQKNGNLVTDLAIQSASVSRKNAEGWGNDWARGTSRAPREAMILFGENVQKINISSGFLMDHIAILPAEKLEVSESKIIENKLFVLLTTPSTDSPTDTVVTIYDGTIIENFQAIQHSLRGLKA
ncbi:hypothetical protein D3C87_1597640 [compost metagenome]